MSLTQKRVILTGGSGGIGRHVALELVGEGAEVLVLSRRGDVPEGVRHLPVDLATSEGIAAACGHAKREVPDILINMAGVQHFGPAESQSIEEMRANYMINLIAPAALCGACLPMMRRRDAGQLVNIGSILGSIGFSHFATYLSAKAGLRAFSEALRRELIDTGVDVTYIAPRAVRTNLLTPTLERYAALTGMQVDPAPRVAARIVQAIKRRKKELYIGFPESVFARLNALFPRLIDAALAGNDRRAKTLFAAEELAALQGGRHV